ncbi:dephospho-CoA kinase [Fistulifera solaris]|uniref:Dephospho-CoA kinase n=1 Tax=Fistulifera solaris TaxID=1519565 RepID=A0A1Z5KLB6_FISSO|nr:dephospho-CoA kinase [Fistulifera solaris]|eukprot:GAX26925.1 dephospho-CoA kinase [Fistulifera solaris]
MVFISTLQVLLGQPSARSVFAFGVRHLTQRMAWEEIVMGGFFTFPLSLLVAHLTVRMAATGWRPSWVRSDLWTTFLITIVGDVFLEILLPSLQCLPPHTDPGLDVFAEMVWDDTDQSPLEHENILTFWIWFQRVWGFACPTDNRMDRQQLLSSDAVGSLLTLRLFFMCLGVYLGESFLPMALTGGIACGKSTVAQLLVDPRGEKKGRNKRRRPKSETRTPTRGSSLFGNSEEEEGTFYLVDADSIGHEILLPPSVLASGNQGTSEEEGEYTVYPNESVFEEVLDVFGDAEVDHRNILDDNGLIDRRKLGAIIFQDPTQRRALNQITHPRIILILLKRLLYGIFWSNNDFVCADIPLLFESGQLRWLFGIVIVVACDPDLQLQRLRTRNPDLTEQQCRDRIVSQMPMEIKAKKADICIWNNGDLDALADQVEEVRRDVMGRVYGIGMSLFQMLLLVGGSLSLAVTSKLFLMWN